MRGRLIAFEGIDGSGKSTQARLLADRIGEAKAVLTSEPGATPLGTGLRRILLDPQLPAVSARAEALLMAADRAEHVRDVIAPALVEGRWVVCDRYSGSTLAYQGYGRGLELEALRLLLTFATEGVDADMNVLIDVPLEVALSRMKSEESDRLERLDRAFHERVREGYLAIAATDPYWVVVDGTGTVEEVASQVSAELTARLGPAS